VRCQLLVLLAVLVSSCTDDVRDLRLTQVDMANVAAVREIGDRLSPIERTALLTYAAVHAPSSAGFCGSKLKDSLGNEPQTIGEAIELTLSRGQVGLNAR
jgi:hypothetical protein